MSIAPSFCDELPSVPLYTAVKPYHPDTPMFEGLEGIALHWAQVEHELAIVEHKENGQSGSQAIMNATTVR